MMHPAYVCLCVSFFRNLIFGKCLCITRLYISIISYMLLVLCTTFFFLFLCLNHGATRETFYGTSFPST